MLQVKFVLRQSPVQSVGATEPPAMLSTTVALVRAEKVWQRSPQTGIQVPDRHTPRRLYVGAAILRAPFQSRHVTMGKFKTHIVLYAVIIVRATSYTCLAQLYDIDNITYMSIANREQRMNPAVWIVRHQPLHYVLAQSFTELNIVVEYQCCDVRIMPNYGKFHGSPYRPFEVVRVASFQVSLSVQCAFCALLASTEQFKSIKLPTAG